jgi:hypothetical protein
MEMRVRVFSASDPPYHGRVGTFVIYAGGSRAQMIDYGFCLKARDVPLGSVSRGAGPTAEVEIEASFQDVLGSSMP